MPISDFVRQVLQGIQAVGTDVAPLMGPNWAQNNLALQRMRAEQAAQAQQSDTQQSQFAQQQGLRQQEMDIRQAEFGQRQQDMLNQYDLALNKQGLRRVLPTAMDGLNQTGPGAPSQGAPSGPMAPTGTPGPVGTPQPQLGPLSAQQGQTGLSMNAAPSGNEGLAAQRMGSPTQASSAGGGVINPAAPPAVLPTAFTITNPITGKPERVEQISNQTPNEQMIPVPKEMQEFAGTTSMPLSSFQKFTQSMKELGIQMPGGKPEKALSEPERQEQSAAKAIAVAHGANPTGINSINDLPQEQQEEAWNKKTELGASEVDKAAKAAALQLKKDREERYANEKASDIDVMKDLRRDGQAIFDIKDKDQAARIRIAAAQEGLKLPTRQIPKQGQMADSDIAADQVQQQIGEMSRIADALGPSSFGPMMGRLNNAEGVWGAPLFDKDDPRAQLEQRFRTLATSLTIQETKLAGGGRASVQLFNAMKDITPGMRMDGAFLQGALKGTYDRAQMTKNSIKRWANGEIEDPYKQYSPYKKGDVVTLKGGSKIRLTSDPDEKGNFNHEPTQ